MNQDQFFEFLWSHVIEDCAGRIESTAGDLGRVARYVRYLAVHEWCYAFDEAELPPSAWLTPESEGRWKKLVERGFDPFSPDGAMAPPSSDDPFADAFAARDRLLAAGVSDEEMREGILRSRRAALEGVRTVLRREAFGPDELAGLHESLWSGRDETSDGRSAGAPGLLRTVRRSHDLAFSPDGSRIVAATGGAITDIESGETVATCGILANTGEIAWSPDGRWIAATSTSGKIALCDASTGKRRYVLKMTSEGPGAMFSPDGATVYGGDWNGTLFAWDAVSGRELRRMEFPGSMLKSLRLSHGRDALDVVVCDRPESSYVVTISRSLGAVERRLDLPERTWDVLWDADRESALIFGLPGWIARMDHAGAVTERRELSGVSALSSSPDGRWYAITHEGGFRISSTADLTQGREVPLQFASNGAVFSRDSKRVAFATWGAGEVWDLDRLL